MGNGRGRLTLVTGWKEGQWFIGGEQVSQIMRDVISQGGRGGMVFGRDCELVFFFLCFQSYFFCGKEAGNSSSSSSSSNGPRTVTDCFLFVLFFVDEKRESVSRRNVETEMSRNESHESMTIKRSEISSLLFESAFFVSLSQHPSIMSSISCLAPAIPQHAYIHAHEPNGQLAPRRKALFRYSGWTSRQGQPVVASIRFFTR
ncbi:hypothetical protein LY78DRAFT_10591 [Colletotrichum sublineola]|nr:hypothetical protein LY78DRAFT_10591 [Colletotrichum sublineola]